MSGARRDGAAGHAGRAATERADVVVIGGGILGCCTAYHLRLAGAGRVVLLEQEPALGTQTSWAGAGFVSLWSLGGRDDGPELALERYALDFYRRLGEARDIGLRPVGFLSLAVTEEGARRLRERYERARLQSLPGEVEWLTAAGIAALAPLIEPSRIRAGLRVPPAVRVEAALATRAVGLAAEAAGAEIRTGARVTAIETEGGRVSAVRTPRGSIRTGAIVDAAGPWLRQIGLLAGVSLPATPLSLPRLVTAPSAEVPPDLPLLIFEDYRGLWVREAAGGLLIGLPGHELRGERGVPDATPPAAHGAATALIGEVEQAARAFSGTVPILGDLAIADRRSGLPTYTPDGRHLLGEAPAPRGFYAIGGDHEVGVTHGPGLGRMLAELITTGASTWDGSAYRLDRFAGPGGRSGAGHGHDTSVAAAGDRDR